MTKSKTSSAILYVIFAVMAAVPASMYFVSWSGRKSANTVCQKMKVGNKFAEIVIEGKKPFQVKNGDGHFYSYLFLMTFDTAAECKVFVDEQNIVTRIEVDVH